MHLKEAQEFEEQIRLAAAELTNLIRAATQKGLHVEVELQREQAIEDPHASTRIYATVAIRPSEVTL